MSYCRTYERTVVPDGELTKTVRVMLVEDHAAFRRSLAFILDREPELEVVAQAGSLAEARQHAATTGFDVAVTDLGLPDGEGTDLIQVLHETNPNAMVLVLSASLDRKHLTVAKEAGAAEVLDKFATPGEIVGAVRRLGALPNQG